MSLLGKGEGTGGEEWRLRDSACLATACLMVLLSLSLPLPFSFSNFQLHKDVLGEILGGRYT